MSQVSGPGWSLSLYPKAAEGGGRFVGSVPRVHYSGVRGEAQDPERADAQAARRARTRVRRYCVANGLSRLGTLTYAPLPEAERVFLRGTAVRCADPAAVRAHVADYFRSMRKALGGKPLPYVWVPELHKDGVNFHIHFALGRYVPWMLVRDAWGRGGVKMKLLSDLPVGSGSLEESRHTAGYLSKYVAKQFADSSIRDMGMHHYDVAQGFQPKRVRIWGRSPEEVLARASETFGQDPSRQWSSADDEDWVGPPAIWAQWGR